ncbi:MAG: glycosyltransferase [Anaerolineales bacterium]|nr:glycosyltransferase [Anaerolineales bacterium]
MREPQASPEMSVVLLVGKQRDRAERSLRSLLGQSAIDRMEILLIDFSAGREAAIPGTDHPAVRYLGKNRLEPFGRVRAEAVRLARGEIVAFLEEHCEALPGWGEAVLRAHAQGLDGVGPEVHSGNPGLGVSDAIALLNYVRWLPPAQRGESDLLVGNNSSYRRGALLERTDDLDRLMACDPILQWKLVEAGGGLAVDPSVKVAHWNEGEVWAIARGYYLWNRMFAPLRASLFGWSPLRVLIRILLLPAVPLVRAVKLGWTALRRSPPMGRACVRALPVILAAQTAAAIGQAAGWILGPGEAETRFLQYELEQDRPEQASDEGVVP